MAKLTKAQWKALADIDRYERPRMRFPTGEALRKAGLVTRETDILIGRDYANDEGVIPQWRGGPYEFHSWYLTPAGRAALQDPRPAKENEGHEA